METKYMHYRAFDGLEQRPASRRGATVAYREFPDGSLRFAIARVHHKDNYNRRKGREVANERLNNLAMQSFFMDPLTTDSFLREQDFREYMDMLMANNLSYHRYFKPRRVKVNLSPVAVQQRKFNESLGD